MRELVKIVRTNGKKGSAAVEIFVSSPREGDDQDTTMAIKALNDVLDACGANLIERKKDMGRELCDQYFILRKPTADDIMMGYGVDVNKPCRTRRGRG